MSNSEEHYDGHDHDSTDDEDHKKAYESILSNPSYFNSTMKVFISNLYIKVLN